ncbi:MAG TPA: SpoIIE family protein phosphatase [Bryobacteraceae bacterium]|nr:SpoIIE family protein phosphatase [Bryobacteraceae bacterium]
MANIWRRVGRVGQIFILVTAAFLLSHFTHAPIGYQILFGLLTIAFGLTAAYQIARRVARRAIWRLRNRLIVAYLFIAVVPIVLILALVVFAGKGIIGQVAVYLVDTELSRREASLQREVSSLVRLPPDDPATYVRRFTMRGPGFPGTEMVLEGQKEIRVPADATLSIPALWRSIGEKPFSGLVVRKDANKHNLYVWAFASQDGNTALAVAPLTHELLAGLVPHLGDVNYTPIMGHIDAANSHVPPKANPFDFSITGVVFPVTVPTWESPEGYRELYLTVDTRLSAVLSILFGQKNTGFNRKYSWGEIALYFFLAISILFLVLEAISLIAGIQLSRSITGAVHELYEGTQHVKKYDFSYRIPVKGADQLAELTNSFNSMTANLGRLMVVAKEKERLESELTIAREVQNQLFPKDVPFTKTLELKGVCHPARMVSGDYYDFMAMPQDSLAFAIGDVAGKGISAALLMATIQSTMRTQISTASVANGSYKPPSTAFLVSNLNRQLYANTTPEKYATFYFAMYDETHHALTYTNAGHLSPLLVRDGKVNLLEPTGTVVGAFPFAVYEERTVAMEHGDMLVAYTDGLVEPENAYGEMFGEERLTELLLKYNSADSSEIIARAMEAVVQWTGSLELQDDMTMVVARRI